MTEFLKHTVDKFIFHIATDRYYDQHGLWALPEGPFVRVGLSDFLQQRSGDVAFAELASEGSEVTVGDGIAEIETIKVDFSVLSPVSGTVVEINSALDLGPEIINEDPYGEGWLMLIEPKDWEMDQSALLDPTAYFKIMAAEVEEELE